MCEILCLVGVWKLMGGAAEEKGRDPIGYQIMGIGLWFAGEIVGAIIGLIAGGLVDGGFSVTAYVFALIGAFAGAGTAFLIVKLLPAVTSTPPARGFAGRRTL